MSKPKKERPGNLVHQLVFEIQRIAKALGIEPCEVTTAKFYANCHTDIKEWQVRQVGGLNSLLNTYFNSEKDIKVIQSHRNHISRVRKLEKVVGNMHSFYDKLITDVSNLIAQTPINVLNMSQKETEKFIASFKHKQGKSQGPRSVIAHWSDQHLGSNIDSEEVGGKNRFDWEIASRRLGLLVDQTVTYKIEKRHLHQELVILLNGDNIGGVIHNQEGGAYELMVHQINGATSYYAQAIAYLRKFFPKVRVICQPGNHGRFMHKVSKDRAVVQKYDSFENIIFYSLSQIFSKDEVVSFEVSKAPFSTAVVQGHKIYVTHGDTVFTTGNVGDTVNMKALEVQINRINADELSHNRKPYELVAVGHVHHPMITQVSCGVIVSVNGSLIGLDPYAHGQVGIHSSVPVQSLWEVTEKYVQGDVRFIHVAKADDLPQYEKIINPYNKELSL